MRSDHAGSYIELRQCLLRAHPASLDAAALAAEIQAELAREAQASVQEQQRIEAADSLGFEAFRQHYLSPQRLVV